MSRQELRELCSRRLRVRGMVDAPWQNHDSSDQEGLVCSLRDEKLWCLDGMFWVVVKHCETLLLSEQAYVVSFCLPCPVSLQVGCCQLHTAL